MTPERQAKGGLSPAAARGHFKALERNMAAGKPLCYLDSAASSLRPESVARAVYDYYAHNGANVHRGAHMLSEEATAAYEAVRGKVRAFLKCGDDYEVIFTSGTTDSLNLAAQSFGGSLLKPGDKVLLTMLEHHANIVPWQMVAERCGARVDAVPVDDAGDLAEGALDSMLTDDVRILAVTHVSNSIGTVNALPGICAAARERGIRVVVDGAQGAAHLIADVGAAGCDFYAFSGHKVFGPNGVGVLCARRELLEAMPPYRGGGSMILSVSMEKTTYARPPMRFEAGTPNVAGVIGLGAALDFAMNIDREAALRHEAMLTDYAVDTLRSLGGVRLIGNPRQRAGIVSFVIDGIHPHDVGSVFDGEGVAVRSGQHCAEPLMRRFHVPATVRASLGVYNTSSDIDRLTAAIARAQEIFR